MSIDISQFHQVFFEESFEGLDLMESALLGLSQGSDDPELIHLIFRAAHSIKGGSGTFGFTAIASFTHVMETLLDEMREGERSVSKPALTLLLQSGDVLRDMLEAARDGREFDPDRAATMQAQLEGLLDGEVGRSPVSSQTEADSRSAWRIQFRPYPDLLKTGNDPVRMFRELAALGEMTVEVDTSAVPRAEVYDAETCYLAWTITLSGDISREQIDEIFEWVDGDCDLVVEALGARQESPLPQSADTPKAPAAAPLAGGSDEDRRSGDDRRKTDRRTTAAADTSIRVSINKIDEIINMVGELVITQSMLGQFGTEVEEFDSGMIEKLRDGLSQLERNTRDLQESVMRIRMLPISFSFNRFPRLVHDLSAKLGKKIDLKISGESTELDKTVMEKIGDPLVHLVRNSLDHGIEMPDERAAKGKPETGVVHLNAYHQGGHIIIEISDDGGGLPTDKILSKARQRGLVGEGETLSHEETLQLIFEPGFSTAETVSDVSGRGVGMDVVRRNIKDLGGSIEVRSERDQGSKFTIRLPLTLAILDGQLLKVSDEIFIIPLVSIVESLQIDVNKVNAIAGSVEMYRLRDDYVPIVRLYELFDLQPSNTSLQDALLVIVEHDGRKVGILVDELLGQQQVVIKSLETNFRRVAGLSGATILGDGMVALILDVGGLISMSNRGPASQPPRNRERAA